MGLFESVFVSKIKSEVKKRRRKASARTVLFAIAMCATPFPKDPTEDLHTLDLSPFTVQAEQMYRLTTEME